MNVSKDAEELLNDLAETLQIPESRYEAATRSYESVGQWLHRPASTLVAANPQVYIQGSFRLGTAIKPASDKEDYDVDLVCELSLSKSQLTQEQLKQALGYELELYAKAKQLKPPSEGRRCWTLGYADGAQFHLDTLPSIPDGKRQRLLLEQANHPTIWADTSIAITDKDHPHFGVVTENWPLSNPKGYSNWLQSRMGALFESRRKALALKAKAAVEKIPVYRVRTPLQHAVQILKHHRDRMFLKRPDERPISVILTTLSGHAYNQETTIASALFAILTRMDEFIESRAGVYWIANPTNPAENFADRWVQHPERANAFFDWLGQARRDFTAAANSLDRRSASAALQTNMGDLLLEDVEKLHRSRKGVSGAVRAATSLLSPSHKKAPPWKSVKNGTVNISRAVCERNGHRPKEFTSNSAPLNKHSSLRFEATTNVARPYKVYWQVVNTGNDAAGKNGLRGGFDEGDVSKGHLTKEESTLYTGTHSIECFIVKEGFLLAQSGQFIVNID